MSRPKTLAATVFGSGLFSTVAICAGQLATPTTGQLHFFTAHELREICSNEDPPNKEACEYYILGVADGFGMNIAGFSNNVAFCAPEGMVATKEVQLVKSFLDGHSEFASFPAPSVVGKAFMAAYPCHNPKATGDRR